jgi:4-diphosphocytidyl-2-C-methyl-D-erythritol kinase
MLQTQTTDRVVEPAPAKINLCLHVTGRRADGYHLLDSLVAFATVQDTLTATRSEQTAFSLSGRFAAAIPADGSNLVLRAAQAVAPGGGVAFHLEKNLPPASGIGGGSADAAAAIRAVLRLGATGPLDDAALLAKVDQAALLSLGADLPVCLLSRPARMRGIGERVDPVLGLPLTPVVLVNPGIEVPTPQVFRALNARENPPLPASLPHWPDAAALARWLAGQRNDLQPAALQIAPRIGQVLESIAAREGVLLARMSGSGATCFGIFADAAAASAAGRRLRADHPGWWVADGALLPSAPSDGVS